MRQQHRRAPAHENMQIMCQPVGDPYSYQGYLAQPHYEEEAHSTHGYTAQYQPPHAYGLHNQQPDLQELSLRLTLLEQKAQHGHYANGQSPTKQPAADESPHDVAKAPTRSTKSFLDSAAHLTHLRVPSGKMKRAPLHMLTKAANNTLHPIIHAGQTTILIKDATVNNADAVLSAAIHKFSTCA